MSGTFADFGIEIRAGATGNVKTICPQCSADRKKRKEPCLSVNVDEGCWHCHHCDWSGGLPGHKPEMLYQRKAYVKPTPPAQSALPSAILKWFANRGISEAVLERNQVGYSRRWMPQHDKEVGAVTFPMYRGHELVNVKYRGPEKAFSLEKGAERIWLGLNDVRETTVIVEGEIDKLACEMAGFENTISVPNGAPSPASKHYTRHLDFVDDPALADVEAFILAGDADDAGVTLMEELARRLGPDRCRRVHWPAGCKDADATLMRFGVDTLRECLEGARPLPISGVVEGIDLFEKIDRLYERGYQRGLSTGWPELDKLYTVRPGELNIVTGQPSHGKSNVIDSLAVQLAGVHDWYFGIFSPESYPLERHAAEIMAKHSRKAFDKGYQQRMDAAEKDAAKLWMDKHFAFVALPEPTIEQLLEIGAELVKQHGMKGLILDPWNEIEHARPPELTETEYVGRTLGRVRRFARKYQVAVWIIAHPTKLQRDKQTGKRMVATPYEISGSANWYNKADNCLTVWRDLEDVHSQVVEVHVQKIKFREVGKPGVAELIWHWVYNGYVDPSEGRLIPAKIYHQHESEEEAF